MHRDDVCAATRICPGRQNAERGIGLQTYLIETCLANSTPTTRLNDGPSPAPQSYTTERHQLFARISSPPITPITVSIYSRAIVLSFTGSIHILTSAHRLCFRSIPQHPLEGIPLYLDSASIAAASFRRTSSSGLPVSVPYLPSTFLASKTNFRGDQTTQPIPTPGVLNHATTFPSRPSFSMVSQNLHSRLSPAYCHSCWRSFANLTLPHSQQSLHQ
ncbi:hypothetical protein BU24DRAFT_417725 [Aaosphaeria arxii CBS 175.79]|uniref:Uncharacterized protein n=1 Tax=Aaosphaeria arxii CBS 175.79 TaxID=1450172 RepID=A0A6A5Y8Z5_9PLEO|nr:uncharacterized protein BU24DRAFT_417725 [Aaosphaeria arxii CBS 175.79]KAF2022072.1 hypothetical protein BU24DRAFT_417725 [Aaosphaeria arxii CBS 175.79]